MHWRLEETALNNPCKWVVCKVGSNDPVTGANYAATEWTLWTGSGWHHHCPGTGPPLYCWGLQILPLALLQTLPKRFFSVQIDDKTVIVSSARELVTTFCNIKYLCNIASDRDSSEVWWRAAGGYLVAVLIKFYCCWSDGSSTLTPIPSCSLATPHHDIFTTIL